MSTAPIPSRKAKKTEMLSVRFDPETLSWLEKAAQKEGLSPSTMVRRWTLRCLAHDHPLPESEIWVTREIELPD